MVEILTERDGNQQYANAESAIQWFHVPQRSIGMVRFSVKLDGSYPELEARLTVGWEALVEAASNFSHCARQEFRRKRLCRNPLVPCS